MTSNDIISMLFDQVISVLSDLLSNDLVIVCLAMLSLLLILVGFGVVQDFLGVGLTKEEMALRSAYSDFQRSKGTWREDLYKNKYRDALNNLQEEEQRSSNTRPDQTQIL